MTDDQIANRLLRVLTAETVAKAELFDYLCWVEETQQTERVPGAKFLFCALDYTTCWGDTYKEAVANGWRRDEAKFRQRMKSYDNYLTRSGLLPGMRGL